MKMVLKRLILAFVLVTIIFSMFPATAFATDTSSFINGGKFYVLKDQSVKLSWGNYKFPNGTRFAVNTEYLCGCTYLGYYTTNTSCSISFSAANHAAVRHTVAKGNPYVTVLIYGETKEKKPRLLPFIKYEVVAISDPKLYTISFNSQGGSKVNSIQTYKYESIPVPMSVTRNGYYFDGWYTKPTGGDFIKLFHYVTGNTTLYAHWTKKK